jgi:fibronectin-binding autotransporter adhesin
MKPDYLQQLILAGTLSVAVNAAYSASNIDTAQPYYLASGLGITVNPAFEGGTLRVDASATYSPGFTINYPGGTVDGFGNTSVFSGVFSNAFRNTPGGLTIANSGAGGSVTLTGANIYTGDTTINNGATLALAGAGAGSIANSHAVVDNGVFDISTTNAGAFIRTLSGNGVVNLGGQSLTLTSPEAHVGQKCFSVGACMGLSIGRFFSTFSGTISGGGGLVIVSGSEILTGANTYSGWTSISFGTLALAGSGSISQSKGVSLDFGSFDISASASDVSIQTLTGSARGNSVYLGARTLILTNAANQFCGGIYCTGGLTVAAGTFALACSAGFTGKTSVNSGANLILTQYGGLNGPLDVAAGASLRVDLQNNPLSDLFYEHHINGTVTMNRSSVFKALIDPGISWNELSNNPILRVTGAGNQFVANGATLNLAFGVRYVDAPSYFTPRLGDKLTLVTAEGGIVGRFANSSLTAGLPSDIRLDAFYNVNGNNSIQLVATPYSYAYFMNRAGGNYNAQSVGQALDRMRWKNDVVWAGQTQEKLRYSVASLNAVQLPRVATALAGEVHGSMASAAPDAGRWLQNALARQLATSAREGEEAGVKPGDNLWFDFNAAQGHTDGDAYASSYGYSRYQFAIGGDILHSQANRFGLGFTYASTSVSPNTGSGTLEETAPFVYWQYALGKAKRVIIDGLFAYGFTTWQTERANPLYATGPLKTNASGSNTSWGVGVRSPWELGEFTVEPFLRVLWQNSNRDSVNEGTASPSALNLSQYSLNGTRLLVGTSVGSEKRDPLAASLTYRASLAFGNDFGDLVHPSVQASLAGESIQINSPHVGRQFAQLNLSGTYRVIANTYAYVGLNGEARENRLDGSVNAGFNFKF